jgi:hypothetical protein
MTVLVLVQVGVVFFLVRKYNEAKDQISQLATSYFTAPDENTPSEFARLVDNASQVLASRLVQTAKSTFMGLQSGQARLDQAVQGDLVQDLASQANPLVGAVLSSFPALRKRVAKSPEVLPLVLDLVNKLRSGPGNDGNNQGKFDFGSELKKYQ